ncbi:hypothetical protein [Roseivivax isoporae]|uniref:SH3b domain-containing protein n=1 Tax=Roseivivax isoporae LMG 25204 TaxID=1449351 RepID=X7F7F3_9RHOB|nr:hypothetical protein [Roseivivax isoporae]ETX28643.1 hypothetical protein RISW2_05985 [Roseivivax isoporae LMG 25204]
MRRVCLQLPRLAAAILALASISAAQTLPVFEVSEADARRGSVIEGMLTGEEAVDYRVAAAAGQVLAVDLSTSNAALSFNILPEGSEEALFIGSVLGPVADVPLPRDGTYVVRLGLMRSAARRNETAEYGLGILLRGADVADGLAGGPDWWQVADPGGDGTLEVHAGPDTRYAVSGLTRSGDVLQNRGCRLTGTVRWCSIRVSGSGLQGWVDGRHLTETAAPPAPEMPEGGPAGNGVPFDATGLLPCAPTPKATPGTCPFGVVRDGPGNAGIWIALPDGTERHILFESGAPVTADSAAPVRFAVTGNRFTVDVGEERYTIPEAVISGG